MVMGLHGYFYGALGGMLVLLGLFSYVQSKEIKELRADNVAYELAQEDNLESIERLVDSLNTCAEKWEEAEKQGAEAVVELLRAEARINELVEEDKQAVEKALEPEACNDIAIPSDVSERLRNQANRSNGDS